MLKNTGKLTVILKLLLRSWHPARPILPTIVTSFTDAMSQPNEEELIHKQPEVRRPETQICFPEDRT